MTFKQFSIISAILFALGIGLIFMINQFLQIGSSQPTQLPQPITKAFTVPGWNTYTDTTRLFTIQHPTSSIVTRPDAQLPGGNTKQILHLLTATDLIINGLVISQSNDSIGGVTVSVSSDVARCLELSHPSSTAILINNIPFKTATWSDAAMGGERGIIHEYRTVRANTCYILESIVHYRDVAFLAGVTGNKPYTATPAELAQQAEWIAQQQKIQSQIIRTFSFSR